MPQLKNYREVGIFDLLSAPLNPIGAFDAEQFKKDVRALLAEKTDEKFLAVDLTGLDFVYSDAYNAFIQFQQEMDDRKGMFAILTNNQTILDGLKKAGLDKNIKVFAYEADMMSFSLQASAPAESKPEVEVVPEEPAPVASQNMGSTMGSIEGAPSAHLDRHTGAHRRFTKSFNAIAKEEPEENTSNKKGLDVPFDDEPSSAKTVIIVVLLLLAAVGGILAFFCI
ncbi:Anti-anti-sigma regulatory factor (antagonist of anti-sigma factor) [Fibrobacter sp. UWT2]|jgi:anti-anti-sigma regulatory factor|uniref:STAS domain-containing protein n=1 Tax=Fibrobacter sp. UWT2 TaxID=1896224 RepID=UPI0009195793|nr:STAS domain-containing protein [Fibrobacter sp. UWT2]SHL20552.1 Anti-anti-sigma regulatory factor (antagonist of anti-sigma factor) [Fibrobacter sp. UWT2]